MIRAASLWTVRQVPIRESWRSFYIAGLRFSEKIREKDFWFSPVNWLTIMGRNWKNVYCSMPDNGSLEKNLSIGYRRKISSDLRLLTGSLPDIRKKRLQRSAKNWDTKISWSMPAKSSLSGQSRVRSPSKRNSRLRKPIFRFLWRIITNRTNSGKSAS